MKKVLIILGMIWASFIAINTSQNGAQSHNISISITGKVINNVEKILIKSGVSTEYINSSKFTKKIDKLIRKLAHGFEFLVLALIISFILKFFNLKGREVIIYTLFIVLLYAVIDEFRQSYIPGRNSSVNDIIIDFIGGIFGVIIFECILFIKDIRLKRKFLKKI